MLKSTDIDFKITKCTDIPVGLQDHSLNILDDNILMALGFCAGHSSMIKNVPTNIAKKLNNKKKYVRGFSNSLYKYSIKNNIWSHLCKLPIKQRQAAISITIDNKIYIWGGYSYTPLSAKELKTVKVLPEKKNIYTHFDGIGIAFNDDKIYTFKIPNLPYPGTGFSIVYKDNKIYFFGGSIYTRKAFNTNLNIGDTIIGKSFFTMDYNNGQIIENSIKYINNFPGTSKILPIFFEHNDCIYILNGIQTDNKINKTKGNEEYTFTNTIDNWKYNTNTNEWIQLNNSPYLLVNQGYVKYKKYIIMIGGCKYNTTKLLNGNTIENNKLKTFDFNLTYNGITNIKNNRSYRKGEKCCYNFYFSNLIILYDIENDEFLLPKKKIDININKPNLIIKNNCIYLVGGEANPVLYNDVYYGTHLSIVLKLEILGL